MPPKPRAEKNIDLPANLYESAGYYTWRDPRTGQRFGVGRDRSAAIEQAREANTHVERALRDSLVARISEPARTLAAFVPLYREAIESRNLAPLTRYERKRRLVHIEKELGHITVGPRQEDAADVTRQAADWLREISRGGKKRTAQAYRTTLSDLFAEMAAAGWVAVNPIEVIRLEAPVVKRARLTLDHFWKIYEAAAQLYTWVPRSLELGLVILQRREDIARMGFRDQDDGRLRVEQGKTGMRIRIPLSLHLDAVGWTLDEIIGRCRDNVLSRHLIHHGKSMGQATAGDPVHPQTITGAFSEARDLAGIKVENGKTPPTYHELRSLGIRLYKLQGYDPQALAGHKDAATTAVYTDTRGAEWIDVAA